MFEIINNTDNDIENIDVIELDSSHMALAVEIPGTGISEGKRSGSDL